MIKKANVTIQGTGNRAIRVLGDDRRIAWGLPLKAHLTG